MAASTRPGGVFDPEALKKQIADIEHETAAPDFWAAKERAGETLGRLKALKRRHDPWQALRSEFDDLVGIHRLAVEEGVFAGISTGANVVGAHRLADRLGPDAVIVTLAVDTGFKYMSVSPYADM